MNGTFPKLGPVPKMSGRGGCYCGRRGLPDEWVAQMYADYKRLGSLAKVGALHNRTRQNMFSIFQTAGLKLRSRNLQRQRRYKGRSYTLDAQGYWRDTVYRSAHYEPKTFLHRRIWIERRGPIPAGHTIVFKDGDRSNCRLSNLQLMPRRQQQDRVRTGANQFTKTARSRLATLLNGEVGLSAQLKAA